jgi:tetratricopeptide (TPR) repeat protein
MGVRYASFGANGHLVITLGSDRTVRVWNTETGREIIPPLRHDGAVYYAESSPDGRHLLTASGQQAQIWDLRTGQPLPFSLKHSNWVYHAAFNADGGRVVTASADRTVRVWDVASGKALTHALQHSTPVHNAVFSKDSGWVLTATRQSAQVWDVASQEPLTPPLQHRGAWRSLDARANHVSNSVDSRSVLTGVLGELDQHQGPDLTFVAFSPDSRCVLTTARDGTAHLWALPTQETRSASDLSGLAVLLAGQQLDATGALRSLAVDTAEKTFRALRASHPSAFAFAQEQLPVWHLHEFRESQREAEKRLPVWTGKDRPYRDPADYFGALWHLDRLIALEPKHSEHHQWRGRILAAQREWARAVAAYSAAIDCGGADAILYYRRGRAYASLGLNDQALKDYAHALEKESHHGAFWLACSIVHARLGQWDHAHAAYRKAALCTNVWDPTDIGQRQELHRSGETAEFWQEVKDDLPGRFDFSVPPAPKEMPAKLMPSNVPPPKTSDMQAGKKWPSPGGGKDESADKQEWWAWRVMGMISAVQGKWSFAGRSLEMATSKTAGDAEAWWTLARVSAEIGQWGMVERACSKALEEKVDDWRVWYLRGYVRALVGPHDLAINDYSQSVERGAPQALVLAARAATLARLRRWAEAIGDFDKVARLQPDDPKAAWEAAVARLGAGDEPAYRKACATLLEQQAKSDDLDTRSRAIWLSCLVRDPIAVENLVRLAKESVTLDPENPAYLRALGAALYRAGKYEKAIEQFEKVLAVSPSMPLPPLPPPEKPPPPQQKKPEKIPPPRTGPIKKMGSGLAVPFLADEVREDLFTYCRYFGENGSAPAASGKVRADPPALAIPKQFPPALPQRLYSVGTAREWLFLAMAHFRCGRPAEGRQWLDRARILILPTWVEWLEVEVLRAEATDLLKAAPALAPAI